LFRPFYESHDQQTQLEAVIATGEAATEDAVQRLCQFLDSPDDPYFLRSAAAWCLSRIGSEECVRRLISAFGDVDPAIREEALEGLVALGGPSVPRLLEGLVGADGDIAAGCAESLRQQWPLEDNFAAQIVGTLAQEPPPLWSAWLAGHLPRDLVSTRIAALQETAPKLHYALSVLWCFVESWIARRWELDPSTGAVTPK
jgi:HEAT repeat protein